MSSLPSWVCCGTWRPAFTRISGFDLAGRPLGKTAPADGDDGNASRVTSYSYVGRETRIHVCGNAGGTCLDMRRNQDSLGRFVRTLDAQGGLTRTWADGSGNVVALQDVAGSTIKASYNALGQRTAVNDPNQGSSSFGYNALGEVLSSSDGRGISTSNSYDKLGRLIGRSANVDVDGIGGADSVVDQWSYDPVGAAGFGLCLVQVVQCPPQRPSQRACPIGHREPARCARRAASTDGELLHRRADAGERERQRPKRRVTRIEGQRGDFSLAGQRVHRDEQLVVIV